MMRDAGLARTIHLIRKNAREIKAAEFSPPELEQACYQLEQAGVPEEYLLPATARNCTGVGDADELAAHLAARIGNPHITPYPPLWPLLAILLLGWWNNVSADRVLQIAAREDNIGHVYRGLALAAYLFPELEAWLYPHKLNIPGWERRLALPLAARRLTGAADGLHE